MRITIDAHNDTLMKVIHPETWAFEKNIGNPTPFNIDLDKMEKGSVNVAMFAAYTDDLGDVNQSNSYLFAMMDALDTTVSLNPHRLVKAWTFADLERGIEKKARIAIQTIEGGYGLDEVNSMNLLTQYRDLGVKLMTLVWDHSNALGEGTLKQTKDGRETSGGLTPLGVKVVKQMESLGIIVDVSHMDEETFWTTLKVAKNPLVASHSGAYAVKSHVRNLKDEQIKAIAENGGVVNVVFCRFFIGDVTSGVETLLDHIEHVIKVGGIDCVGLGSDFDGATMPVDLPDMSHMQCIADGLLRRGYSDEEIDGVMGGNMLRLLKRSMKNGMPVSIDLKIIREGEVLKACIQDPSEDMHPQVWVNGVEIPCEWKPSSSEIVCRINSFTSYKYLVATLAYENRSGNRIRKTQILHNEG